MKLLKKTTLISILVLIIIFLSPNVLSSCVTSLSEAYFYPNTYEWLLTVVVNNCGETIVGGTGKISKEEIKQKSGVEPLYDFELILNGNSYYQWGILDDNIPMYTVSYLVGEEHTCTALGLGTCTDESFTKFQNTIKSGGYTALTSQPFCIHKSFSTKCYLSVVVKKPVAAKGSFSNAKTSATANIKIKAGDKISDLVSVGNNGQDGVKQSYDINYNGKDLGSVQWVGLLMSGQDKPILRVVGDANSYPFYQTGWKLGKETDYTFYNNNLGNDNNLWDSFCRCLVRKGYTSLTCSTDKWNLGKSYNLEKLKDDIISCTNELSQYTTNALRTYSVEAISQSLPSLPVGWSNQGTKTGASLVVNPNMMVAYPELTFKLNADWIGIKRNYAIPKITSLSYNKCTSGITGDDGYLNLVVQNREGGSSEAGINIYTRCTGGIEYLGLTLREQIPTGTSKAFRLPIDANIAVTTEGTCGVRVEDNQFPSKYFDEKTITVTCDPKKVCTPNSYNCEDYDQDNIPDSVKCNAAGSGNILVQRCTKGCLITESGAKCVETTCGNDVIDSSETCENCPADINKVKPGSCIDTDCKNIPWYRIDKKISCWATSFFSTFKIITSIIGGLIILLYSYNILKNKAFTDKKQDYLNWIFGLVFGIAAGILIYTYVLATLTALLIVGIIIIILLILFPTFTANMVGTIRKVRRIR